MKCLFCATEVVPGLVQCPNCGEAIERSFPSVLSWVRDGLDELPKSRQDGPNIIVLHSLGLIVTFVLWSMMVIPFLTTPPHTFAWEWVSSILGLNVVKFIFSVQAMVLENIINKVSILLATWVLAFCIVQTILAMIRKIQLKITLDRFHKSVNVAADQHTGIQFNSWLARSSRFIKAIPIFRELFEELSNRTPEPAARFEERTQRVLDRCRRASAPVRVAVWAIPILGFIGTVLGISAAIQGFRSLALQGAGPTGGALNFLPQFQDSMGAVMSGLATAFHTTLIALVIVLPAAFLLELACTFEEVVYSSDRTKLFMAVWLVISPSWRADIAELNRTQGEVASEHNAAAIMHMADQLATLGNRISATSGIVENLGSQVERLERMIETVDIQEIPQSKQEGAE